MPDTRSPGFAAKCRRQSLLVVQADEHEADTLRWLEHLAVTDG